MEGATPHKPSKKTGFMHLINKEDGSLVKKIPLTQNVQHRTYDYKSNQYKSSETKLSVFSTNVSIL